MRRPLLVLLLIAITVAACGPDAEQSAAEAAADLQAELPNGWSTLVVNDTRVGSYVLAAPDPAVVWVVGDPIDQLSTATDGSSWASFWLPVLDAATSDRSNVRVVVADTATVSGDIVSFHVNVNPHDPGLEFDDAAQLADQLQGRFAAQGLDVRSSGTTRWRDRVIAEVTFRVPAEVFDGDIRYVRQWFIAQDEPPVMWSFTCDAPEGPEASDEACRQALDGFVPSPGGAVDAA